MNFAACELLLRIWCDGLLDQRVEYSGRPGVDGSIACPCCGVSHGRAIDAVYPLLYLADRQQDQRCLSAVIGLMRWSDHVSRDDGAFLNESTPEPWVGTTVFAVIAIAEALTHHGHVLPQTERERWTNRLGRAAEYVADFDGWFGMNVNYPIAAATALAAAAQPCGRDEFATAARSMLRRIRESVLTDDLIAGEGMQGLSPRGVSGVDIGYNVEESLPNLALLAKLLDDRDLADWTTRSLEYHLQFFLPDGGWDNSWGTRNAKWTYFGSRTTDGAGAALTMLVDRNPAFLPVFDQTVALLKRCTHDGLLFGGPHVHSAGRQPCVQHTIMHAKGFAAALNRGTGFDVDTDKKAIPVLHDGVTEVLGHLVWLIRRGPWRATITASDATCPGLRESAPTGGALSLLHHSSYGPVFAASMTSYSMVEPLNMPAEFGNDVRPLTPRVEAVVDGIRFTQLNDRQTMPTFEDDETTTRASVQTTLCDGDGAGLADKGCAFLIRYSFSARSVSIAVSADPSKRAAFVLPVVCSSAQVCEQTAGNRVRFAGEGGGRLTVECDPPSALHVPATHGRIYNPVPGFQAVELIVDLREAVEIVLSFE